MFLISKGKLHVRGISFSLPEGWYLDTDSGFTEKSCLHLMSEEKGCEMDIQLISGSTTAKEHISQVDDDELCPFEYIQEIETKENKGLERYEYIAKVSCREMRYESIWELKEGIFCILVFGAMREFEEVMKSSQFQEFIDSVEISEIG